ncbi:MAG TPA: hypothetical protein PLO62_07815 [Candidatus Hydrogenedentes bacterium]|nr:hypothetical protein [Candidatus Hydrogenedentota bacterium]HOS02279.1 hypothetical protein [Candidatus Hydrogenedentota bacterium]
MADVSLQLVREFFELNLFQTLTNWQQEPWRERVPEHSPQMFLQNTRTVSMREPAFVLPPEELPLIERAVVEVRAWHADRFYPSVIEANPVLFQFAEESALALAREVFAGQPFVTILILSELPVSAEQRRRAVSLLQAANINHVMEFPAILQDLLHKVSANVAYPSPTLQTLRLLKRYKFIRHQQMELPFAVEPTLPFPAPFVETAPVEPDSSSED